MPSPARLLCRALPFVVTRWAQMKCTESANLTCARDQTVSDTPTSGPSRASHHSRTAPGPGGIPRPTARAPRAPRERPGHRPGRARPAPQRQRGRTGYSRPTPPGTAAGQPVTRICLLRLVGSRPGRCPGSRPGRPKTAAVRRRSRADGPSSSRVPRQPTSVQFDLFVYVPGVGRNPISVGGGSRSWRVPWLSRLVGAPTGLNPKPLCRT